MDSFSPSNKLFEDTMKTAWIILIGLLLGDTSNLSLLPSAAAKNIPKLEIIRKAESAPKKKVIEKPANPDELITRTIIVPPTFLSIVDFSEEDEQTRATARKILEAAGISFPPGTSALYNPGTSQLIVRQTFSELVQVESFLEKIRSEAETMVHFQFEIFQLPTPLARKILDESKLNQNHSLQRDAVLKMAHTQQAKQISRIKLSVREGQSTKYVEGTEYHFITKYRRDNRTNKLLPIFESRNAGTEIFVHSVNSKNDSIIPFEFKFKHHFAAPKMKTTEIHIAETNKIAPLLIPVFHSIMLCGDEGTVMKNNTVKIIGRYQTAGYDKNQSPGQTGIVFLKTHIKRSR